MKGAAVPAPGQAGCCPLLSLALCRKKTGREEPSAKTHFRLALNIVASSLPSTTSSGPTATPPELLLQLMAGSVGVNRSQQ